MSASWPGNMRGPRLKIPLLLLLLLLTALTRTVFCSDEYDADPLPETIEEEPGPDPEPELDPGADGDGDTEAPTTDPVPTDDTTSGPDEPPEDHGSGDGNLGRSFNIDGESTPPPDPNFTDVTPDPGDPGLSLIIILIPVVLVVVIIAMIVCGILINRRWKTKARNQELHIDDPHLDGSSTEKVPMPMFEEDVPSVLELEMDELDQWMKKDSETAEDSNLA